MPRSFAEQAPGFSVQESTDAALSVASGATAVPVFIGRFRNLDGSLSDNQGCIRVDSYVHFQRRFGESTFTQIMLTQGSRVIVEIGLGSWSVRHYFENGGGRCYVLPVKNSADAEELAQVASKIARCTEIDLYCCTERGAGLNPLYAALEPLLRKVGGGFLIADSPDGVSRPNTTAQRTAIYFPGVQVPYGSSPADSQVWLVGHEPGQTLEHKRLTAPAEYIVLRREVDHYFSTAYPKVCLNASPAVAGVYCQVDRTKGVWSSPAGVLLNQVTRLHNPGNASLQLGLTAQRINPLKHFPDDGVRVWGARTAVDPAGSPWLNIAASRLFDNAARDMKAALRFAVFRPNNELTWSAVRNALHSYLEQLWRAGALRGAIASEAFYVQVGEGVSMTAAQVQEGELIVRVGMAPLRALEFIEVIFTEQLIAESSSADHS